MLIVHNVYLLFVAIVIYSEQFPSICVKQYKLAYYYSNEICTLFRTVSDKSMISVTLVDL